MFGARFEDFFFVFDDDLIVGDFNDFLARDSEFGIDYGFQDGALDNDLLNDEIFGSKSVVGDFT